MKLSELAADSIYAYRPRTSDDSAKPALVLEDKLWRSEWKWNNWDGAEKRTRQTVFSRAVKGDRAGSSSAYHANSWTCGVPVLIVNAEERFWMETRGDNRLLWGPFEILARALDEMDPFKLVEEGHDGRVRDGIKARVELAVPTFSRETQKVVVTLELVRPQTLVRDWKDFFAAAEKRAKEDADFKKRQQAMKAHNDQMAASISARVSTLLGEAEHYTNDGERYDVRRKPTNTGISKTYQVSEEVLLKLLALAERSSSQ